MSIVGDEMGQGKGLVSVVGGRLLSTNYGGRVGRNKEVASEQGPDGARK